MNFDGWQIHVNGVELGKDVDITDVAKPGDRVGYTHIESGKTEAYVYPRAPRHIEKEIRLRLRVKAKTAKMKESDNDDGG